MMKKNQIISERLRQNNGFTLIEVIAVLVIAAIIAAVVVARGMSMADVNLQAEVDTLKGHLRYAQYLALNENDTDNSGSPVKWGIYLQGPSYTLVKDPVGNGSPSDFQSPFLLPNESSDTHSISPFTATEIVLFDQWGSPYNVSTKLVTPWTITLTQGSQSKSIKITQETGFMQ